MGGKLHENTLSCARCAFTDDRGVLPGAAAEPKRVKTVHLGRHGRDAHSQTMVTGQLAIASDVMMAHPFALQLSNLRTLVEVAGDENSIVAFPAPMTITIAELAGRSFPVRLTGGCARLGRPRLIPSVGQLHAVSPRLHGSPEEVTATKADPNARRHHDRHG